MNSHRIAALHPAETDRYVTVRPRSAAAAAEAGGFLEGVPMHWMRDWPLPFPMVVAEAQGAVLVDIDGNRLIDFCLGDTGAMYGHAPAPILAAMARSARTGFTHMLPTGDAAIVGRLLAERFGLPHWQVAATASDANRFAIRVARAVTGRSKILVFDGCYHGAVDDTLVDLVDGKTVMRPSLLGQATDARHSVSVPFNDVAALEAALAGHEIAVVVAEPAMTNCSMILPEPGFHDTLRRLTRAAGTLLLIDETHTLSSGYGGYARVHELAPDFVTMGKPIAGGMPASIWGMSADLASRYRAVRDAAPAGYSGIGTTLAGSALQLACIRACLEEVMTPAAHAAMEARAAEIEAGLSASIEAHALPWHVARVGARLEIVLSPTRLRNAADARAAADPAVQNFLHLALLNRGYLLTPFHDMMLVCPDVTEDDAFGLIAAFDAVAELLAG